MEFNPNLNGPIRPDRAQAAQDNQNAQNVQSGGTPSQEAISAAMQKLQDQRSQLNTSRAQMDPESEAILQRFAESQGGDQLNSITPLGPTTLSELPAQPVYGAPIRGRFDEIPAQPVYGAPIRGRFDEIPAQPVYGAPIRNRAADAIDEKPIHLGPGMIRPPTNPSMTQPLTPGQRQKLSEAIGRLVTEAPVQMVYGAPIRGQGGTSPFGELPAQPVYGAPIRNRLIDSPVQMVYGAPIRMQQGLAERLGNVQND